MPVPGVHLGRGDRLDFVVAQLANPKRLAGRLATTGLFRRAFRDARGDQLARGLLNRGEDPSCDMGLNPSLYLWRECNRHVSSYHNAPLF